MFSPEIQRRLERIATLWNEVEGRLKAAERLRLEIVVGAINELRYAGRLVVDAIAIAGNADLSEAEKIAKLDHMITEIENNTIRANADITDALILFYSVRFDQLVEAFGLRNVMQMFSGYTKMRVTLRTINEFMALSREDRLNRREYYVTINNQHLPELASLYQEMTEIEDQLLPAIAAENRAQWFRDFFGRWGFWLGVLGGGALVAGWIKIPF